MEAHRPHEGSAERHLPHHQRDLRRCVLFSLEHLRKKDLEVLHLVDSVDEYAVQLLKELDGKMRISTTKKRVASW